MVLAGNRILCSLGRPVMPVTRRDHRSARLGGKPSVAYHACCHAAERGQNQHHRQYGDALAQRFNHGFQSSRMLTCAEFPDNMTKRTSPIDEGREAIPTCESGITDEISRLD
jgi:hypothetical protein